jgi:hypothetical protein
MEENQEYEMLKIDVDEILEIHFLDPSRPGETNAVQVIFRNGDIEVYEGPEFVEAVEILKHWKPPTA